MNPITIAKNVRVITSKEEDSLDKYFKDVNKFKLLTPDEERQLAKRIHEGDRNALNKLVNSNLRFVISVAKQYQNKGVLLLDLINEGNIGLIQAAEKFDETKGFRFISYAVWWIRQSIMAALTDQSHMIHIPFNQFYDNSRIKRICEDAKQQGKNLTEEEVAELLNISIEEAQQKMNITLAHTVSLDNTISTDEDKSSLIDIVPNREAESPDAGLMKESLKKDLLTFIYKILDEREAEVIILNYGLKADRPMSFDEIADYLGVTKECIRQVKEKAIRKMRLYDGSLNETLKQYL